MLLHIPAVQRFVASETAAILSKELDTKVSVGSINLGLLNRAIIDDILIEDQQHRKMFHCHRLSAKVEILPLFNGKISISSAQIFGLKALLVKPSETEPLNCQFVIDALSSKDTTSHTPLDLHISSLVVRNTSVKYDQLDIPKKPYGFDPNHVCIEKLSSHMMLYALTDDSLSMRMKKLSMAERNCGFNINNLSFDVDAGRSSVTLSDFSLLTDHSDINIDVKASLRNNEITQYALTSKHSSISMRDVAAFVPSLRNITNTIFLDADVKGDDKSCNINSLGIRTPNKDLDAYIVASASSDLPIKEAVKQLRSVNWDADIQRLHVGASLLTEVLPAFNINSGIIGQLGSIDYTAKANGRNGNIDAKGTLSTSAGQLEHKIELENKHLTAQLNTSVLRLGQLLNQDVLGDTQLDVDIAADITDSNTLPLRNTKVSIVAPLLTIKNYPYRNTKVNVLQSDNNISAEADIADMNINALISASADNIAELFAGNIDNLQNINIKADISNFNPHALGLTADYPSTTFNTDIKATIATLANPLERISAELSNISMISPDKRYACDNVVLNANENGDGTKDIILDSDFASLHATGKFNPATLPQSIINLVSKRLPTLPGIASYKPQDNDITLTATVSDTEMLQKFLGIDIEANKQIDISAHINDRLHIANIAVDAPSLKVFGNDLNDTHIRSFSLNDTLSLSLVTAKMSESGIPLNLQLDSKAANNNLRTTINWQNGNNNDFRGSILTDSQFFLGDNGNPVANVKIQPSTVIITDTLWNMHPSVISYTANKLAVNKFLLENGHQYISINGKATKSPNDSLVVSLQDINVGYIMNLVDFHSVEFEGFASGTAVGKSLFSDPEAYADIDVSKFLFENGRLGTLTAHARWNDPLGQIDIDAQCYDPDVVDTSLNTKYSTTDGFLKIDGFVGIKQNNIDLDIKATNVRLEFVKTYTSSFLDNLNAWASGRVRIIGPLSAINLVGEAHANGSVRIIPLNTTYQLRDDYVKMIPNEIMFMNDTIYDKNSNIGIVNGALHHNNLSRMTFDLDIDAKHLLCFDFPTLDGSTFCGHVIGSGNCNIKGRTGEVTFDIDAYPEATSYIEYNASSPDALQDQEFITWRSKDRPDTLSSQQEEQEELLQLQSSNVHLNFLIHATPDATLRLLMDQRTGDYINLHGNGTLRAHYYNKGGMQIFGNYAVEGGDYKMTIQQVISKNFEFLKGGTLAFGGDPMQANIDLKAQYVVPSASLADLNIGNSFKNTTVRVNCLMNITGTAEQPKVDFDFNIPQASPDIQQMITSLMDSEEARNQQVVYLLAIGRFYNATNTLEGGMQSQASLAMQSFLSGTVSQQLNNLISNSIIKNNNWNFGANISPGDEGMMNAEYEGLVSGRMLNNRLLINGQFGYRDNVNATTSFIGDFDVRYLLFPNGNLQVKVYNQATDRYFTKSNINTQGIGIILNHDFKSFIPNFLRKKKYSSNGK